VEGEEMIRDTIRNFRHIPRRLLLARARHQLGLRFEPFNWCGYRVDSTQKMLCWWELGRRWGSGMFSRWPESVPDNPVVLDVGANYGVFGWIVRKHWPKATIFGYEPLADCAVECRKLGCYDDVRQVALGRAKGMVTLTLDDRRGQINASTQKAAHFVGVSFLVPMMPLDYYDLKPDVVKVDVEGAELEVIAGGLDTLYKCPVVIVECWDKRRARDVGEALGRKAVKLTREDYLFQKQVSKHFVWERKA